MSNRKIEIKRNNKPKSDQDYFDTYTDQLESVPQRSIVNSSVKWIRQTFIVKTKYLESIKDLVHTRRMAGDTD